MRGTPPTWLGELEQRKIHCGEAVAARKLELLRSLARRRLDRATDVRRLHDVLCFIRAYPDNEEVLDQVESMLENFSGRSDLRKHRESLADSGIAGTPIYFSFFPATAIWLARRWGEFLTIDWAAVDRTEELERILPELVLHGEVAGLDNYGLEVREWLETFKSPAETDARFLLLRLAQLRMSSYTLETRLEQLDVPLRLAPGPDTPARTREKQVGSRIVFPSGALRQVAVRPDREIARAPTAFEEATLGQGRRLLDLARSTMVTRHRDLDAFAYGDPRDVRLVDCGNGLRLAFIGLLPERRFLLECLYGFLVLQNGVAVGYGSFLGLFSSVEIAFTVFDNFRAGDPRTIYGRLLATARHRFGFRVFSVDPYQLGRDNEDGIRSGAWWFYRKMGFEPRAAEQRRLMRGELRRLRADPSHRSSASTLRKLADANVFLGPGRARDDVIGVLPLENIGIAISRHVAQRFGHDRKRAEATCSREAASLLNVGSLRRFSPAEKQAWRRWGPLVPILPGIGRWTLQERRDLVAVIRAKGARRESEYLQAFDAHPRLRRSIRRLALRDDA